MRRHHLLILVSLSFILLAGFVTLQRSQAQITEGLCIPVVRQALQAVGNNCSAFDRNSACYGYNDVVASFVTTVSSGSFSRPNDSEQLAAFERIETQPYDSANNTWGIALMNVQANLPDTFPGQNVVFMLLGDSEMENAVEPGTAFSSGVLVPVTTQVGSQLFAMPTIESSLMAIVPPGITLDADATSADSQWVRVTFRDTPGWLMREGLTVPDAPTLPVFDPATSRTPMQAFYFRTGLGQIDCQQAPDTLVVQGPRGITVDITANGADIQLGSTILIRTLPYDTATFNRLFPNYDGIELVAAFMQITVLDGKVIINPYDDEEDQIIVEEGYTTITCLSEARDLGLDGQENDQRVVLGCNWTPPRLVEESELAPYTELEGFVLNYPIELPDVSPRTFSLPQPGRSGSLPTATATAVPPGQPTSEPPTSEPTDVPTDAPTSEPTPTDIVCPPASVFNVADGDVPGLIAAIDAANRADCFPGADTITLAANGNYGGILTAHNTTAGANALPVITSPITINGNGSQIWRYVEFSGASAPPAPAFRLFYVAGGSSLTLNDVTLFGGEIAGNGGLILNDGSLTINNSSLTESFATNGGAVYNNGTLTVSGSSMTYNGVPAAFTSGGGGLYNAGTATLVNSTLSTGGGLNGSNLYNTGTVNLSFVTLYGSSGTSINLYNAGTVNVKNALLAGAAGNQNCGGTPIISAGGSVSSDATCSGIASTPSILIDPIPRVNGSPRTLSHALLAGSPAINAVTDCATLAGATVATDQRGAARPFGAACDSGAYEAQAAPPEAVDIQVEKNTGEATLFNPGDLVFYTISVTNNGPANATGVVVQDVLPPQVSYVSHDETQGTYTPATGIWNIGALANGDSVFLTIEAEIGLGTVGMDITNTASLTTVDQVDANSANNQGSATLTVEPPPVDLVVGKTVDNNTPFPGGTLNYEVSVTLMAGSVATNVVITDLLPAGLTFVSATPEQGTYNNVTGVWTVGALFPESTVTLDIVATVNGGVTPGTVITNTASLTSLTEMDTNITNNQASAPVTVTAPIIADIAVGKTVDFSAPEQGSQVIFTITAFNNGPNPASGLIIADLLPAGLTFISADPTQGTYNDATGLWTIGALSPATGANLDIAATVTGAVGTPITNTATVDALDQVDNVTTNNTGSITIVPVAISTDIGIFKIVDDPTPLAGDTIQFTVEAANLGGNDATSVIVTDLLPAGLTFVSAAPTQGTYNEVTGVWNVGGIDADTNEQLVITATVGIALPPGTLITNTATLTSFDQNDSNASNNQSSAEITVTSPVTVDIAVGKVADDTTPAFGQLVMFTITANNLSASAATNVVITDALPGSLSYSGASPTQGTYTDATGIWDVGTIPGGGSATLQLGAFVTAEPGSVIDNTATLTSVTETDTNVENNQATATLNVAIPTADIGVSKIADNLTPAVGSNVIFTVTVTNNGPDEATSLVINDTLPGGLSFVGAVPSVGGYDSGAGEWTIGTLAASANATLSITAQVVGEVGVPITNQASVQAVDQSDPTIGNDIGSVTITPVLDCPGIPDPITSTAELITAIDRANDEVCNPGANTLNMNPGTYDVTASNNDFFGLNGLPVVNSTITINGNGAVIQRVSATQFRFITVSNSGSLTLNNLTLTGGEEVSIANGGGALHSNTGPITLNNVTLTNNRALWGGAISTVGGSITVNNSTLSGNEALNGGGAADSTLGTIRFFNSTLSGNTAQFGGGVHAQDGTVNLSFVTIWNNTATFGSNSALSSTGASTFNVRGSLIGGPGSDICFGVTINDLGGSRAESACGAIPVPPPPFDVLPLGSNGGPTQTHALGPASPALSAVDPCTDAGVPVTTDQRGQPRGGTCDAGSFELP